MGRLLSSTTLEIDRFSSGRIRSAKKSEKRWGGEEVGDSFGEATVVVGEKLWHFVREEGETFFEIYGEPSSNFVAVIDKVFRGGGTTMSS